MTRHPLTGSDAKLAEVIEGRLWQSGCPVDRQEVESARINAIVSVSAQTQPWIEDWLESGCRQFWASDPRENPRQRISCLIPLLDASNTLDEAGADAAIDLIVRLLDDPGRRLLVHCDMGAFRSVHVCACAMSFHLDVLASEAFKMVDCARGMANPRSGLSLAGWKEHIRKYDHVSRFYVTEDTDE